MCSTELESSQSYAVKPDSEIDLGILGEADSKQTGFLATGTDVGQSGRRRDPVKTLEHRER